MVTDLNQFTYGFLFLFAFLCVAASAKHAGSPAQFDRDRDTVSSDINQETFYLWEPLSCEEPSSKDPKYQVILWWWGAIGLKYVSGILISLKDLKK
jgi:hypothetical protein